MNNGHNDNRHYAGYFILASPSSGNVATTQDYDSSSSQRTVWILLGLKVGIGILLFTCCICSICKSMRRRQQLERENILRDNARDNNDEEEERWAASNGIVVGQVHAEEQEAAVHLLNP